MCICVSCVRANSNKHTYDICSDVHILFKHIEEMIKGEAKHCEK